MCGSPPCSRPASERDWFLVLFEQCPERRDDRWFRRADRRDRLIALPAAAQRLVERGKIVRGGLLGLGIFVLQPVFLTLGIEQIEEIGEAAIIAFLRQLHRVPAGAGTL